MSLCRDKIFLCRDRVLAKTRGFLVAIGQSILCRDRVWPRPRVLVLRQSSLCRDRAWLRPRHFMSRQEYFIEWCSDRVFYVSTQVTRNRRLLVATEGFYVAKEFGQARSFLSRHNVFML